MPNYSYYIVEHAFVVRREMKVARAERLTLEGEWTPYHDLYDITMNGRWVTEEEAMEAAQYFREEAEKGKILEERRKRISQKASHSPAERPDKETKTPFGPAPQVVPDEAKKASPEGLLAREEDFLDCIRQNSDDDFPRLGYADWLTARGDPRGEFIRRQIARSHLPEGHAGQQDLMARESTLLGAHYKDFAKGLPEVLQFPSSSFRRGFISDFVLMDKQWRQRHRLAFLSSPHVVLTKLTLRSDSKDELTGDEAGKLAALPCLASLAELVVTSVILGPEALRTLVTSPNLAGLRKLQFSYCRFADAAVKALAEAFSLDRLESLTISSAAIGGEGARALAACPNFTNLQELNLSCGEILAEGARALAESPNFPKLTKLDLSSSHIGVEGVRALAASPYLRSLSSLILRYNQITDVGASLLATSGRLSNLSELFLDQNEITDAGVRALAASSYLSRLVSLGLATNKITCAGARALAMSSNLPQLSALDVTWNQIADEGVQAIATSPHLGELRGLGLSYNPITDEGARALAASTRLPKLTSLGLRSSKITAEGTQALADSANLDGVLYLEC